MNPLEIIWQNFPHCMEWRDDSFLGILDNESRLDRNTYWKLEWAITLLTQKQIDYPRQLSWPVFRIFSHASLLLKANVNPDDGYKIEDFNSEQSRDFSERFQLVFEGFFKGEPPDLKLAFDELNPLMQ